MKIFISKFFIHNSLILTHKTIAIVVTVLIATTSLVTVDALHHDEFSELMVSTDFGYANPTIHLINTDTDQIFSANLTKISGFPTDLYDSIPMHAVVTPDSSLLLLSLISSDTNPSGIAVFEINSIDWDNNTADITYNDFLITGMAGATPSILEPEELNSDDNITKWKLVNQQTHGPTIHPNKQLAYFTQWTDNQIWAIDVSSGEFADVTPIQDSTFTRQLHGVFFNANGNMALGASYYFDMNYLPLFHVDKNSGDLNIDKLIPLTVGAEEDKTYAAYTHYVDWVDNRYAYAGTMQVDNTSLTPSGFSVELPSVFLIDAKDGIATQVILPDTDSTEGIKKPISDVLLVGDKLYVAEENSMTPSISDGSAYVSVWDISDINNPVFLKRLEPGVGGMPEDFHISHSLAKTNNFIYTQDWFSGYLIKIDTRTDDIVKVFDKTDGLINPHGAFIKGNLR